MSDPRDTRILITQLAAQQAGADRTRSAALPLAMALAGVLALAPVVVLLGVRDDLMPSLGGLGGQKVLAGAITALCAGIYCHDAARPDAKRWLGVLLLPGLVAFTGPALLGGWPFPNGSALLSDPAGPICFGTILALSLLPLGALIVGLRRSAPGVPAAAGLAAGALAAGLAACAYALHCTADTASVTAFWYPASVLTATILGGTLGGRWLSW